MTINIQAINFSCKPHLNNSIEKKLEKIKRLYSAVISIDIKLTLNKQAAKLDKLCTVRLGIPGYDMFSNTKGNSFEEAVAKAVEALERQIAKRKTKMRSQLLGLPLIAGQD